MTFQRARTKEQREIRRQAILDTAAAMLDEMPVAEVSLNELSRRVGLAKSNVLRYFESREAVLLELLDRAITRWMADLSSELAAGVDPHLSAQERGDQMAAVLSASSHARWCCATCSTHRPTSWTTTCPSTSSCRTNGPPSPTSPPWPASSAARARARRQRPDHHHDDHDPGRTLSAHCRHSATALAAYEADPTVLELRLDLRTTLENALAALIRGTLTRS